MSTPINSIIFPGSPEKYLLRDHRATTSETGAANSNEFGFIKIGYQGNTQSVPVSLDENGNAYVDLSDTINSLPTSDVGYLQGNSRWLIFDFSNENRRGLKIKKGTKIKLDITDDVTGKTETRWLKADEDLHYDFSEEIESFDTLYGANGENFYVYLVPDGENDVKLVISMDSEYPSDVESEKITYTSNNTRKIGQFHTLCVDVGDNVTGIVSTEKTTTDDYFDLQGYEEAEEPDFYNFYHRKIKAIDIGSYYNVATLDHPLSGFVAGDILPESVFCLSFHPDCKSWDGMVYLNSCKCAVDIYLLSGAGSQAKSEYGATYSSKLCTNALDDCSKIKKRLPTYQEFIDFALGSNVFTNIAGGLAVTTGGHVDTEGRRMISFIGCEECCGCQFQQIAGLTDIEANLSKIVDGQGSLGHCGEDIYILNCGGDYNLAHLDYAAPRGIAGVSLEDNVYYRLVSNIIS